MTEYVMKDMSGSLFKNGKKEKETHPDYKGEVMINGEKLSISAWLKEGKSGVKYMSLSFQAPWVKQEEKVESKNRDAAKAAAETEFESDVPF